MDAIAKLLQAAAALAWPVIVVGLILMFRPALGGIIESAKSRKFKLKIGGQELTMNEANEVQRELIADLQTQVVALRKRVDVIAPPLAPAALAAPISPATQPSIAVLWVDDNPKNNSFLVEQLNALGGTADIALSTAEGLSMFANRRYTHVISDMARSEGGRIKPDAGIDLLRAIRAKDSTVPFIIYCSRRMAREYGEQAIKLGASHVTTSPTALAGLLGLDELKARAAR